MVLIEHMDKISSGMKCIKISLFMQTISFVVLNVKNYTLDKKTNAIIQ